MIVCRFQGFDVLEKGIQLLVSVVQLLVGEFKGLPLFVLLCIEVPKFLKFPLQVRNVVCDCASLSNRLIGRPCASNRFESGPSAQLAKSILRGAYSGIESWL